MDRDAKIVSKMSKTEQPTKRIVHHNQAKFIPVINTS